MIGLAIVMGLVIFFSTYFYQEKHFQQDEEQFPIVKSFLECFKNVSFLIFEILSFSIIYVQTGLMQGVLYYFDELKVPGLPLYISLFCGIILGVFLWIYRRDTWGVKKCLQIWTFSFALGCLLILLFGQTLIPSAVGFLLLGIGFAGGMYLIPIMNGDVIDMDEHRTGLRREGMYAGVNSFITKPAISLAQAAFLSIITRFGYDQTLAKGLQSSSAQSGILIGWMLIPALLLFVCFIAIFWYPLAGPQWDQIKHRLALLHAEKEKQYLEDQGYKYTGD
jgi:GPH family glycoside/pentoside/hexuronide:cation symporter